MKRPSDAARALAHVSTWKRGERTYWRFRRGAESRMLPDPAEGWEVFRKAYDMALKSAPTPPREARRKPVYRPKPAPLEGQTAPDGTPLVASLVRGAKGRAKRYGLAFGIDEAWFRAQFEAQGGLCAISGIPMVKTDLRRAPWSPSIDRKVPAHGYTPENCQLVCAIVNFAKNRYDMKTLLIMCRAVLKAQKRSA